MNLKQMREIALSERAGALNGLIEFIVKVELMPADYARQVRQMVFDTIAETEEPEAVKFLQAAVRFINDTNGAL